MRLSIILIVEFEFDIKCNLSDSRITIALSRTAVAGTSVFPKWGTRTPSTLPIEQDSVIADMLLSAIVIYCEKSGVLMESIGPTADVSWIESLLQPVSNMMSEFSDEDLDLTLTEEHARLKGDTSFPVVSWLRGLSEEDEH
jgi:hypothetical protein